jgi:hypothetical protein
MEDEQYSEAVWWPEFEWWLGVYWLKITTGIHGEDGIAFVGSENWIQQKAIESAIASYQKGLSTPYPFCIPVTVEYQIDEEAMDAYLNGDDEF